MQLQHVSVYPTEYRWKVYASMYEFFVEQIYLVLWLLIIYFYIGQI